MSPKSSYLSALHWPSSHLERLRACSASHSLSLSCQAGSVSVETLLLRALETLWTPLLNSYAFSLSSGVCCPESESRSFSILALNWRASECLRPLDSDSFLKFFERKKSFLQCRSLLAERRNQWVLQISLIILLHISHISYVFHKTSGNSFTHHYETEVLIPAMCFQAPIRSIPIVQFQLSVWF